jgi:hypothetical protein
MPSFAFSEPTPTVAASGLTHSGRGGAGNVRYSSFSTSTSKPIRVTQPSTRFYTGIGGAGNSHAASERKPISFEEDFERARARENLSVTHCGIGGAGNVYRSPSASDESSSERRTSETSSFWGRLSISSFSRRGE